MPVGNRTRATSGGRGEGGEHADQRQRQPIPGQGIFQVAVWQGRAGSRRPCGKPPGLAAPRRRRRRTARAWLLFAGIARDGPAWSDSQANRTGCARARWPAMNQPRGIGRRTRPVTVDFARHLAGRPRAASLSEAGTKPRLTSTSMLSGRLQRRVDVAARPEPVVDGEHVALRVVQEAPRQAHAQVFDVARGAAIAAAPRRAARAPP